MPLNPSAIYPSPSPSFIPFPSRRSVVHSTAGIVACTQPLAAAAGISILHLGGNAADAAVAVAAALNMTEPASTGIGGDMFCLFYDAASKKVRALNGSGRAGGRVSAELIRRELGLGKGEKGKIPMGSVHAVTVPGAPAGWVDCVERFGSGKVGLGEVLGPAVRLGEEGFPVAELSAAFWGGGEELLRNASPNYREMLKPDKGAKDGCRAPRAGELFKNANLARTFRELAEKGKKGFYEGRVAEELVKVVQDLGGHLTLDDLKNHADKGSEEVDAVKLRFNGQGIGERQKEQGGGDAGVDVWEHPPNGQGIVALMALGLLEDFEKTGKIKRWSEKDHNSEEHLHAIIEALRIAFADATWFIADPSVVAVPTADLISPSYLSSRAALFSPSHASPPLHHGSPAHSASDTVYFAVTDAHGNGASFINSNYGGFGTGIVPRGCGFTLQNRGANFELAPPDHPNVLAPDKRPYHTIIPAMLTNAHDGSLHTVFGVMGGFMQPQGHVQVLLNMLVFGMNPQEALDAPRVLVGAGMPEDGAGLDSTVYVEEGISEDVVSRLEELGHRVTVVKGFERAMFGRGQVIRVAEDEGRRVYSAGSDLRGDGAALPA